MSPRVTGPPAQASGGGPAPPVPFAPEEPRSRARAWRADLVTMAASVSDEQLARLADWLGFDVEAPTPKLAPAPALPPPSSRAPAHAVAAAPPVPQATNLRMPLLRLEEATFMDEVALVPPPPEAGEGLTNDELEATGRSLFATPRVPPLAPWRRLWPVLCDRLQVVRTGRAPDVPVLVRAMGKGQVVRRIPRVVRRAWTARLALWLDWSARLAPLFEDQSFVWQALKKVCGNEGVRVRFLDEGSVDRLDSDPRGRPVRADPDTPILVLGDLGAYGTESDRAAWLRAGERLQKDGARLTALVPAPAARIGPSGLAAWRAIAWERAGLRAGPALSEEPDARKERVDRLLRLASAAVVVQAGLLRVLRRLLPASEADVSTEIDAWNHPAVRHAAQSGLVLGDGARERYREGLAQEADRELLGQSRAAIREWHGRLPVEIVHAETLAWTALAPPRAGPSRDEVKQAADFVGRFARSHEEPGASAAKTHMLRRGRDAFLASIPQGAYRDSRVGESLGRLRATLFGDPEEGPPPRCGVSLVGRTLVLRRAPASGAWPKHEVGEPGSPVAWLPAARPRLRVLRGPQKQEEWHTIREGLRIDVRSGEELVLETDRARLVLEHWSPELWASGAGRDRFGLWADAEVNGVVQRFRWIPPGRFLMGSPETEEGRYEWEGPQHQVAFTRGYWLADTPCTQAFWKVVMGKNPSQFMSPDRPVEQVSWDDCQVFLERLARLAPGLEPRLPGEAEWEHACRAGTATATWLGDLEILGDYDAPLLHEIAWYGGNCGVDFDLKDGFNTRDWEQKQFPHERGGSRRVGQKDPSPLGLHDMLGNVYEWCEDHTRLGAGYDPGDVSDPAPSKEGDYRVLRGGSWPSYARYCRAADRDALVPRVADDSLGFRLVRGHAPSQGAEPQEGARSGPDHRDAGRGPVAAPVRDAQVPPPLATNPPTRTRRKKTP